MKAQHLVSYRNEQIYVRRRLYLLFLGPDALLPLGLSSFHGSQQHMVRVRSTILVTKLLSVPAHPRRLSHGIHNIAPSPAARGPVGARE